MSYVFFVEYTDGRRVEKSFPTAAKAKRAYTDYNLRSEYDAKAWGWEKDDPNLLSRQVAKLRIHGVA